MAARERSPSGATVPEAMRGKRGLPVVLTLRVDQTVLARIEAEATRRGVARSALVASVLTAYVAELPEPDED